MPKQPERLLGLSDIAREVGLTRQAIADFQNRGKIPPPDFAGPKGGPLWRARKVAPWIAERANRKNVTLRGGGQGQPEFLSHPTTSV